MNPLQLMRPDLVELEVYPERPPLAELESGASRPIVRLDANENPYGPSPRVPEALAGCCVERYPDADCTELRIALGCYLGVEPEKLVCSSGGDEMLELLSCYPGHRHRAVRLIESSGVRKPGFGPRMPVGNIRGL